MIYDKYTCSNLYHEIEHNSANIYKKLMPYILFTNYNAEKASN